MSFDVVKSCRLVALLLITDIEAAMRPILRSEK